MSLKISNFVLKYKIKSRLIFASYYLIRDHLLMFSTFEMWLSRYFLAFISGKKDNSDSCWWFALIYCLRYILFSRALSEMVDNGIYHSECPPLTQWAIYLLELIVSLRFPSQFIIVIHLIKIFNYLLLWIF